MTIEKFLFRKLKDLKMFSLFYKENSQRQIEKTNLTKNI